MDGASIWERETQGVIPRCVDALFDCIQRADNNIQFTVIISFYEVGYLNIYYMQVVISPSTSLNRFIARKFATC